MDGIRQYVISVTAAAVMCGILKGLLQGKGTIPAVFKLVSGLFLVFTVLGPVTKIDLTELPVVSTEYLQDAQAASLQGEKLAAEAVADIIKQQTEAYILDKARMLEAEIEVSVTVSEDGTPVPVGARLSGTVTPYARARLEAILEEDLGISKENQIWIG